MMSNTDNHSYAGVATHYLHSSSLPDLEQRFAELKFKDNDSHQRRLELINSTIEEFTTGLPHDKPMSAPVSGEIRKAVDYAFQPALDYKGIITALDNIIEAGTEEVKTWAEKTKKTILQRSPTSVQVTIQQLREGRNWSIAETFQREHIIASQFMRHADFIEGVSSLLIRKPKTVPQWNPATAEEVKEEDIAKFFSGEPDLALLTTGKEGNYKSYPHAWTSLPSEEQVRQLMTGRSLKKQDIINHFVKQRQSKLGVAEKVGEIIDRKTAPTASGHVEWEDL